MPLHAPNFRACDKHQQLRFEPKSGLISRHSCALIAHSQLIIERLATSVGTDTVFEAGTFPNGEREKRGYVNSEYNSQNKGRIKKSILSTIAVAALLVGCSDSRNSMSAKDATAASQFGDLPPTVQSAVKREVPNGIVDRVSTETKEGRLVYKIKFQERGLNPSIWVTADGSILKSDINATKRSARPGT